MLDGFGGAAVPEALIRNSDWHEVSGWHDRDLAAGDGPGAARRAWQRCESSARRSPARRCRAVDADPRGDDGATRPGTGRTVYDPGASVHHRLGNSTLRAGQRGEKFTLISTDGPLTGDVCRGSRCGLAGACAHHFIAPRRPDRAGQGMDLVRRPSNALMRGIRAIAEPCGDRRFLDLEASRARPLACIAAAKPGQGR